MKQTVRIFWHRRDLRLHDNAGAYHALNGDYPVLPLFIFDWNILNELEDTSDARIFFIHQEIMRIKQELEDMGSTMLVRYGKPEKVWAEILQEFNVADVYTNRDYEPYARQRDEKVANLLAEQDIPFHTYKDHVVFEELEITKKAGGAYTVFTPYSRSWREKMLSETYQDDHGQQRSSFLKPYDNEARFSQYVKTDASFAVPTLAAMGFSESDISIPSREVPQKIIKNYDETRNFPGIEGTSRLGIHFRFGTISIRQKAGKARQLNDTYLNELIWRDFYAQILANFPQVVDQSFRREYDYIEWRNNEEEFKAWCEGRTGYPMVDAGMRELNTTGYMHNRVRMVTASFLTKHLLIDWRWGEAYFGNKLLDYELASNNGGWQWAAGSGTDAAPYFRIFNPASQLKKFDKDLTYVKKWVPEYGTEKYADPIVEHKFARERCLERYKAGLDKGKAAVGKA